MHDVVDRIEEHAPVLVHVHEIEPATMAQQVRGTPGAPNAVMTPNGLNLPAPSPPSKLMKKPWLTGRKMARSPSLSSL